MSARPPFAADENDRRPIEGASASSACQTNDSNTAYLIVACAIAGIVMLVLGAIIILFLLATAPDSSRLDGGAEMPPDSLSEPYDRG